MAPATNRREPQRAFEEALKRIAAVRKSGAAALDLTRLGLQSVPPEIGQLAQLRELDLSGNQFTTLPEAVGELTVLQGLYLWNNQLTTLPEAVGRYKP